MDPIQTRQARFAAFCVGVSMVMAMSQGLWPMITVHAMSGILAFAILGRGFSVFRNWNLAKTAVLTVFLIFGIFVLLELAFSQYFDGSKKTESGKE